MSKDLWKIVSKLQEHIYELDSKWPWPPWSPFVSCQFVRSQTFFFLFSFPLLTFCYPFFVWIWFCSLVVKFFLASVKKVQTRNQVTLEDFSLYFQCEFLNGIFFPEAEINPHSKKRIYVAIHSVSCFFQILIFCEITKINFPSK